MYSYIACVINGNCAILLSTDHPALDTAIVKRSFGTFLMEVPKIIPLPREWNLLPGTYDLPQNVSIGFQGVGAEDVAYYLSGVHTAPTSFFHSEYPVIVAHPCLIIDVATTL